MNNKVQYPRDDSPLWENEFYAIADEGCRHRGGKQYEPLEYLAEAAYPGDNAAVREGASYKSLAYIAHRMGMSEYERKRWYTIAERLPLSQAHAAIIIARLNERDKLYADLDALTTA